MKGIYYILLLVILVNCAKEKTFDVHNKVTVQHPTKKVIYKVEVLDGDFSVCSPGDADGRPDLYLQYGYGTSWVQDYQVTSVLTNVSYDSLPISLVLSNPLIINEDSYTGYYEWRIYDQDGTSPNTSIDNFLGGYNYERGSFNFSVRANTVPYIGYEGTDISYSTQYKLILKFYYRWE